MMAFIVSFYRRPAADPVFACARARHLGLVAQEADRRCPEASDDGQRDQPGYQVLPEEAEILTLAQETGTLTLSLRNPEDMGHHDERVIVDQRQLLTGERARELQEKRYRTIQIIRGPRGVAARGE